MAAVCLLSAVLSGCGGGSQARDDRELRTRAPRTWQTEGAEARAAAGELNVGIAQDLDSSLDPHKTVKAGTREVMFNVFEGLLKPDASGNLNPAVAESYTVSDDHLLYTFKLRSGVKFHNGQDVTPEDVIWSYQRCADADAPRRHHPGSGLCRRGDVCRRGMTPSASSFRSPIMSLLLT